MYLIVCTFLIENDRVKNFVEAHYKICFQFSKFNLQLYKVNHQIQEGVSNVSVQFEWKEKSLNEQQADVLIQEYVKALSCNYGGQIHNFTTILEKLS